MTAISGLKCAALLRSQNPLTSWVRMLLESSRWNSTVCFLTWKISATPRGRLLFRLAPWMPDTDETGFGYLVPTPTSNQAPNKNANTNGPKTTAEVARTNWAPGKLWPTPNTKDGTPPRSIESLKAMIADKRNRKNKPSNLREVMLWPTPTAQDAKNNGAPSQMERNTKLLNAEIGGSLNPEWVCALMGYPPGWTNVD